MAPKFYITSLFLLLASLPPLLSRAGKLDSLMQVHDTTVITYFYYSTDSLFMAPLYRTKTTRLTGFQRYDPVRANDRYFASLGNIGLANYNLVFQQEIRPDFDFGMHSFDLYTYSDNKIPYYQHYIPVTYLRYNSGPKKEQSFRAVMSLHLAKIITVAADFGIINSPGPYYNQKSDDKSFVTTGQYFTKNKRYGIIANYTHNKFIVQENGGIVNDSVFEENLETDRRLIDVNLQDAQNLVKQSGVFINQYFFLAKGPRLNDSTDAPEKRINAGRISYSFRFDKKIQIYTESDPTVDFYKPYDPIIDSTGTYDSLLIRKFSNQFSWSNLALGQTAMEKPFLIEFSFEHQYVELSGYADKRFFHMLMPAARIAIRPFKGFLVGFKANYTRGDFNDGGYEGSGMVSYDFLGKKENPVNLGFELTLASQEPAYFYEFYQSNHFRWDTTLQMQHYLNAVASCTAGRLSTGLFFYSIDHFTYLDQLARPAQYNKNLHVIRASADYEFRWRYWSLATMLAYQIASEKEVLHLPNLIAKVSLFPTLSLFSNAAILQPGLDFSYNTEFYGNAYMPATRQFYLQDEKKIGNYVYVDLFVNLMIKRFRFFAQMQHINAFFSKNRYYMVPHYPMQDAAFKFGLSWNFYD